MHQIACTVFKNVPGVTVPDPFWYWVPDSGPLPSKFLAACEPMEQAVETSRRRWSEPIELAPEASL